jgi:hypothetical protein
MYAVHGGRDIDWWANMTDAVASEYAEAVRAHDAAEQIWQGVGSDGVRIETWCNDQPNTHWFLGAYSVTVRAIPEARYEE